MDSPTSCARGVCGISLLARRIGGSRGPLRVPRAFLAAIVAIGLAIVSGHYVPARFDYTIAGAVLASLVLFSESLAWQTAVTATFAAFGWDFLDYQTFAPRPLAWAFLVVTTAVVAVLVARYSQDASHAPPGDLDRGGQRLPLSPAAVQRGA